MRHALAGNKLGRKSSHRKATVRDIAKATLVRQRITTTKAKAKEAKKLVDKLITLGKKGTLADKRRAYAILCDHKLVSELFVRTSPRFKDRSGGYSRIIPLGYRRGDHAQLAFLELTEKDEVIVSKPKTSATVKKDLREGAGKETKVKEAKPKAVKVEQEKQKKAEEGKGTEKAKEVQKEQPPKKDEVKAQPHPHDVKEKPKGKKFINSLRRMFQRKTDGK